MKCVFQRVSGEGAGGTDQEQEQQQHQQRQHGLAAGRQPRASADRLHIGLRQGPGPGPAPDALLAARGHLRPGGPAALHASADRTSPLTVSRTRSALDDTVLPEG